MPEALGIVGHMISKSGGSEGLGLLGGDRSATLDDQQIALGDDIILAAQGIELGPLDDRIQAAKVIRDQPPDYVTVMGPADRAPAAGGC